MAGMNMVRLKGSTLMEVLVAITIITTVISICTVVFVNVTGSTYTAEKLRSILLINEISLETKRNRTFFDEEIQRGYLMVSKRVDQYNSSSDLWVLHLAVHNESKKLLMERKEIIFVGNE